MLRRSASQIFGDSTPQKQWAASMSSSSFSSPSSPPHYQGAELVPHLPHTSAVAWSFNTAAPSSLPSLPSLPSQPYLPLSPSLPMLPRNQIEAMPPSFLPQEQRSHREIEASWSQFPSTMVPDSSLRHPVFFTERLKRAPNGVGAGGWISPVAAGYVFEEQNVRRKEENARL